MRILILAAALAAGLSAAGCTTAGTATTQAVLSHLETCDRHYTGAFGPTGANGTVEIDCKAQVAAAPALASPPTP